MLAHLAHADKAFTDGSINCALMEEWICFYSLPFLPRVRLASDVKVESPSDLQTCFPKKQGTHMGSPAGACWHPQDQDQAGRSQEAQLSLPRKRVCDLTNSLWKNWARLSSFRYLFPSGRATTASGQHKLLLGHLVTRSRELICPKNNCCA